MKLLNSIILVLLFSASVSAQETTEPFKLRNFGGLNTLSSDFTIKPNEARRLHEIDLSRKLGAWSKRYGYDSVSTISGMDSIIDIYGAYYSDGSRQLYFVSDSDGTGYGAVYKTAKGSIDISSASKIYSFYGTQRHSSFTMLNDRVYISNSRHMGVVSDGTFSNRIIPPSPGQAIIVPSEDGDELDGEYLYVFYTFNEGGSKASQRVKVDSGRMVLTDFQYIRGDTLLGDPSASDFIIYVYRSKANPGPIRENSLVYATGDTILLSSTDTLISDTIFIDSIADGDLGTPLSIIIRPLIATSYDKNYGSPKIISTDTIETGGSDSGVYNGMDSTFLGGSTPMSGWYWTVSFQDTLLQIESDTGASMFFLGVLPTNNKISYNLALPKVPDDDSSLSLNLYRAQGFVRLDKNFEFIRYPGTFYRVAQLDASDTNFVDTLNWDSLTAHPTYVYHSPPPLDGITTLNNRLYGFNGSKLYFSKLDSGGYWGGLDFLGINTDDGDNITAIFPSREVIRVMKNFSSYNVFQDANFNWNRQEVSSSPGCISPFSRSSGDVGNFYLSRRGVELELDGAYLSRTVGVSRPSIMLDNFNKLSLTDKHNAASIYYSNKYMLSIGDTTFIYDLERSGWSTWGFRFGSATYYNTNNGFDYPPSDTMYFVKQNDSSLYRYGSSETDNGATVNIDIITAPFAYSDRFQNISNTGLWVTSLESNNPLYVEIQNEGGDSLTTTTFPLMNLRHRKKSVASNLAKGFSIRAYTKTGGNTLKALSIDGIDIYGTAQGGIGSE